MPRLDLVAASRLERTSRVKQLEGMFDVPATDKLTHRWQGDVPVEKRDWNVGLIVGPSGCGKSQVMRKLFGEIEPFKWRAGSVVDDFGRDHAMKAIADVCSAGSNPKRITLPSARPNPTIATR